MDAAEYPIIIERLSEEDGGGFLAFAPDLPGCMSDGQTREEAALNLGSAIVEWIEEMQRLGRPIPAPSASRMVA